MKNLKVILGAILWIIVIFTGIYFYQFNKQTNNLISVYSHLDSVLYEDVYERYEMERADIQEFWIYTGKSQTERRKAPQDRVYLLDNSFYILDSLKKNDLITLNSIITHLPKDIDTQSIIYTESAWIAEEATNPKAKYFSKIWLSRVYAKAWIDVMKSIRVYRAGFELKRIKGDSIGVFINSSDVPKIYLKQKIDIDEDQNKFSITTHYFGKDTLTVKKNYRITTPKGQKIKPFDYVEIK